MVQLYKIFDIYMVYYSSKYIFGVLDSFSIFRGCYKKIFLQNYKILNDLCRIISGFFHEVRVKRKRKIIMYSNTSEYTFCTSTSINGGVDIWLKIFFYNDFAIKKATISGPIHPKIGVWQYPIVSYIINILLVS